MEEFVAGDKVGSDDDEGDDDGDGVSVSDVMCS